MAEQYEVLTEALTGHAGRVDGIADQVAQAAAAGQQMSLPSDAYGALCLHLALRISELQALGTVALMASGKHLSGVASGLRVTAAGYAAADEANDLALQHATEVR